MINKKKREIFFIILLTLLFVYVIFGFLNRKINENNLDKSHIFIAVNISKINFGNVSTAYYNFSFDDQNFSHGKMCTLEELRKMNVGDIYLVKFNEDIEFSELMCDCKLSRTDNGKVWDTFPGCNN